MRSSSIHHAVPVGLLLLLVLTPALSQPYPQESYHESGTPCYDNVGKPKRCIPEFGNAAYGLEVEATNTCGVLEDTPYCIQTGAQKFESCGGVCRAGDHPPSYLTDINNPRNQTWWQSETMLQDVQWPNMVNLTLRLKKAFDITYVRVWFYSPRPESFAIYKRTREGGPWTPFQFYSGSCRDTYGLEDRHHALDNEETTALCTSEYSDISPLTGGNIAFSTLEGRRSAHNFNTNPNLQEWVTATDIRIVLNRMNTFGDEVFGDPNVLKSYFYAITDIAVGARCKCNGHASECVSVPVNSEGETRRICRCEHNTAGPDCSECASFYQDAPWRRATDTDAYECRPCNCNGFSNRCFFDKELYAKTGHGGHCLDCTGNRDGPNCERCRDDYYQKEDGYCVPCNCDEKGSRSLQCNSEGKCQCKPGVTGDKCDRCADDFYDFSNTGCKECNCLASGSLDNQPKCDQYTGLCVCKDNVEGKECRRCKLGYFNLVEENEFGCTPCFCYGHSSVCSLAPGYSKVIIQNNFARNNDKWTGYEKNVGQIPIQYNGVTQVIGISAPGRQPAYFVAPDRFLGDWRASYNQELEFKLRIGETGAAPAVDDIILEGAGLSVKQAIFGQGNSIPSVTTNTYIFKLHEHPDYGWQPTLPARKFMSLLSNLTAIKIRGTFTPKGVGFLDDVKLTTARRGSVGPPANWIERCSCPDGYIGQFCESCAPGFRHDPPSGGPFSPCVPCNCNSHADICDPESGRCICQHNTAGENCERCARGYYGNALDGTPNDCEVCPCPGQGACIQLGGNTVVCLECPKGYGGARCDLCSDGYYGEDRGFGTSRKCEPCDCNNNVDPNAVGNCNRTTGECLKCIYNTGGPQCDQCLAGYYGDALAKHKGDCKQCRCSAKGTEESTGGLVLCDQLTGQCKCKPFVVGTNCDQCQVGYYNIGSGKGCEPCDCDSLGSTNSSCDVVSGQCYCKPGVTGRQCDVCETYSYGFSTQGCTACDCDEIGSVSLQCNADGQCPCLENVEGRRCDRCKENKYDRQHGCIDCPACYSLVQDAVQSHRNNLDGLDTLLKNLLANPTVIDSAEFDEKLKQVQDRVQQLSQDALRAAGGLDEKLTSKLNEIRSDLETFSKTLEKVNNDAEDMEHLIKDANKNVSLVEAMKDKANEDLEKAFEYIVTEGEIALSKAKNRSAEFGQQNKQMTDIAHQARETVLKQIKEAEETKQIAEMAANISNQAYELSREALDKQKKTSSDLSELETELQKAKGMLESTSSLASSTLEHTSAAYKDTLSLFSELQALTSPSIDATAIKEEAQNLAQTGNDYLKEAQRLNDIYETEKGDIINDINTSEDLLNNGTFLQQKTDELLADADAAKAKAAEAVMLGNKTLKDAQEIYDTLQDFDRQLQESKEKAKKSLEMIPAIETMLQEAKEKTTNANEALAGAEINAQSASDIAQKAQKNLAQQASNEADKIRKSAEATREQAVKLRMETDELAFNVSDTESKLLEKENKANRDLNFTREAKGKVAQAQTNANTASRQVKDALSDIEKIFKDLSESSDIDEESLDQLEQKLNQAEQAFKNSSLDEEIAKLKKAKLDQIQQMKNYELDLASLRIDVDNIEDIRKSLPDGCWKRLRLEP